MSESTLRELFDKYDCDKGFRHSYDRLYEPEFEPIRFSDLNILEVGVLRGESIDAWLDYFPNAMVWGIDTFERIDPSEVRALQHPRVRTVIGDSQSSEIRSSLSGLFDIIIDDGEHSALAVQKTFSVLSDYLAPNGVYYIEDFVPTHEYAESAELPQSRLDKWHPRDVTQALEYFAQSGFDVRMLDVREYSGKDNSVIVRLTHGHV